MLNKKPFIVFSIIISLLCLTLNMTCLADELQDIGYLEIEEVSAEPGLVSNTAKQFRLIVHHNPNYIPAEALKTFDRKKSPVLTSLQIVRKDLNRKKKNPKNIRSQYEFQLEADSSESTKYNGFLETHYLSNSQIIKRATRLNFKVDVFDYLDDLQTIETRGLQTKFSVKYDVESLALEFNSMNFNGDVFVFTAKNPKKKMSKIISDTYSIEAKVQTSLNLSNSVKNIQFKEAGAVEKKIAPRIRKDGGKKSHRLIPKLEQNDITIKSAENNFYEISIPMYFQSKKKLTEAERLNIENLDLLVVPIYLDIKTGDNRDLNLSGILREKTAILFDNGDEI